MKIIVNAGERFNRLVVIKEVKSRKQPNGDIVRIIECICDCGNKKSYCLSSIRSGHTKSCGCFKKGKIHLINKTHGLGKTMFYYIYHSMKARCDNPKTRNYFNYGGRGIKCLWNSFEEFRNDMYPSYLKHLKKFGSKNTTIDRIDVNRNYSKENCRWATQREQANNTRKNVFLEYNGKRKQIGQWAIELGINKKTLFTRIYRKWSIERILATHVA